MKTIRKAYGKINLTLEIFQKRADGYHDILSVMQKISLADELTFETVSEDRLFLTCDREVCAMTDNLAYKAAEEYRRRYREKTGGSFGLQIHIHKVIPDKAGLAGGSADAACVLDYLFDTLGGLSYREVEEIASSLGSDINFCLDRYRCALCSDRGITLTPCAPLDEKHLVVCVPDAGLKTAEVYGAFDKEPVLFADAPSLKVREKLEQGNKRRLYPFIRNAFTPVCARLCPPIGDILSRMHNRRPLACEMSGSGSAVFGIFGSAEEAQQTFRELQADFPRTFLCHTQTV